MRCNRKEIALKMKKDDFLKILSSITPNEMHNFIETKNKKRKLINVITILNTDESVNKNN